MNSSKEINNSRVFQLPHNMRFVWYKHQNSLVQFYEHDCMEYETFGFYFRTALCNNILITELAWGIGRIRVRSTAFGIKGDLENNGRDYLESLSECLDAQHSVRRS